MLKAVAAFVAAEEFFRETNIPTHAANFLMIHHHCRKIGVEFSWNQTKREEEEEEDRKRPKKLEIGRDN